jgi:hypothetical protein
MQTANIPGVPVWYDHRALEPAWRLLPGGPDAIDPCSGESWQYQGSRFDGRTAYHNFRHRWHPTLERRVYLWIAEDDTSARIVE